MIANLVAAVVLVLMVGGASLYIASEKRKGVKCIGCPVGKSACSSACSGLCCSIDFDAIDFSSLDSSREESKAELKAGSLCECSG